MGDAVSETRSELECLADGAKVLARALESELQRDWPAVHALLRGNALATVPDEPNTPPPGGYGRVPPRLAGLLKSLASHSPEARSLALRATMLSLFDRAGRPPPGLALPSSVTKLYPRELNRILRALGEPDGPVSLDDDRWRKNLAILTGRLLPIGAEFADIASGIPRSTLLEGGRLQGLRVLRCIALETRGFRPLLELHAHPDSLDDFSPEGWLASYRRLAELLRLNPHYKGVMASSWFRDPALAAISPRLRYLREYPERHGARMFKVGADPRGESGALARSPTRQRLFREGRYVPSIYLMIWPRQALLDWHDTEGASRA